jgi:hypothetical protein
MTWATDTIVKTWADPVTGTVYEFPHDNWGALDLAVAFVDDDGVEIPLVLGADYSVSPTGRATGGHLITLIASVPTDIASLQVRRHTRTRQEAPAPTGAEGAVDGIDRAIAIAAELRYDLGITALLAEQNRDLLASLVITGGDVDASVLDIWNRVNVLEALWPEDTIMLLNAVQTATNKTFTAPVINAGVWNTTATGSAILTDAGLTGASADTLASSQAIVDYVAAQGFAIGYGTIDEHSFASDGATFAVLDIREPDFEFEMEGVTATTLTVSFSTNGGTSWGTAITLASSITANSGIGRVRAMTDSTRKTLIELTHSAAAGASAGVARLQPTAQAENAIRFGGIEAGKIYMRRVAGNVTLNDPNWLDVGLLVQGGFVDQQGFILFPDFVDLSPDARTITHSASGGSVAVGVITGTSIAFTDAGAGNDVIYWGHDARLDPGGGPFTWEHAMKLSGTPGYRMTTYAHWGSTSPEKSYFLFVDPNGDLGITYRTSIGGADNTITFAAGLVAGAEYRIAMVLDATGTLRCNVNGVYVGAPTPLVGSIVTGGDDFTSFGRRLDGGGDLLGNVNRLRMTQAERTDFSELGLFLAR